MLRVQGHLDTPGTGVSQTIASTDPLSVHSDLSGVVMSRVEGVFAPFLVVLDPVTRNLDIPSGLGPLGLFDAAGTLTITSTAGVPAHLVLQISGTDGAGGAWSLMGAGGAPLMLDVPAAPPGGSVSAPLALTGANSNLPDFLGHLPSHIQVTGTARVGDGLTSARVTSQDSFHGHFELESALNASFSDSRIGFDTDSVKLGSSVRDQIRGRLSRVRVHVTIENGLPLGADATLHLAATRDEIANPGPGTITLSASAPAAGVVAGAQALAPGVQDVVLEITGSQIDVLQHSPIYLGGNVHLPGTAGQKVRVRGQDEVKARAWLEAEGKVVR